jgi:hypothetical protein
MRTTREDSQAALRFWIVPLAVLAILGCQPQGRPAGGGHTYTVRAKVVQLPAPNNPASGLYLSHEAIDRFVDRDGKIVGMDPMTMPFPLADGVALDGLQPGDVVELKLHVDWGADPEVEITGLRELPADTKLSFRNARPTGPPEPRRAH